jgi:hypothetical protein
MRIAALAMIAAAGCITTPNLTVEKTGEGTGTISADAAGIDCGEVCGALFEGTVTLTATPTPSALFAGWSGAEECGAEPTCQLDITENTVISARFDRFYPTITVIPSEQGTVNARGIDCGSDCDETYDYNTFVTLTATPAPSWTLVGWIGAPCTPPAACTFKVTESIVVEPVFGQPATLHVDRDGTGSGHVFSTPIGIDCGAQCDAPFSGGSTVKLTAMADQVSLFVGWVGCDYVNQQNDCVVQVSAAHMVAATFVQF